MIAARPQRPHSVILPLVLIVAGAVLLLTNSGTLPADSGWRLLELWPLLLVMVGIQLVVSRLFEGRTASLVALVAIGLVALGGLVYVVAGPARGGAYTTFSSSASLEGVSSGSLTIDAAGSRIELSADAAPGLLYDASVEHSGAAPRVTRSGGALHLTSGPVGGWDWNHRADVVRLHVSPEIPWSIVINGAGVSVAGSLAPARLTSLTVNGAGATADLQLGTPAGQVPVRLAGVGSEITVSVPAATEYRMSADGLATTISGVAETPGWAAASDRYDLSASGVAARLAVREWQP